MILTIPAYAREARPGDVIEGRTVTGVSGTDPVRIVYTTGDPSEHPREGEIAVQREFPDPATEEAP